MIEALALMTALFALLFGGLIYAALRNTEEPENNAAKLKISFCRQPTTDIDWRIMP